MYGTTYDTIQNRYRKIRKEADALKAEVESGERTEVATPRKGARGAAAAATPRSKSKAKDALGSKSFHFPPLLHGLMGFANLVCGSCD